LRQLRARTAIALGEHDHFFSTVGARHAASLIPNSSFRIIPGVGHSPNWEAPEAVLHAIVDHTAS
jgi:pimeloyl-ACP methyl ester carboxylesterase